MNERENANFKTALAGFDFERVHSVMEYMDWKWVLVKGNVLSHGVPSVQQMKNTVMELFYHALLDISEISTPYSCAMTGGFCVKVYKTGNVKIEFILEKSEGMGYENQKT